MTWTLHVTGHVDDAEIEAKARQAAKAAVLALLTIENEGDEGFGVASAGFTGMHAGSVDLLREIGEENWPATP